MINFYAFSGLLTFITSLGFGIFSWIKGTKRLNKIWAIFCLCVAIWGFGCFKFSSSLNQPEVFWWLRFGHIGVILMPAFFLHFILEFLELRRKTLLILVYLLTFLFLGVNITDWFGKSGLLISNLRFVFDSFFVDSPPAPLYPVFVTYFFGIILWAHLIGFRHFRNSRGLKRTQLKYFLAATVLGFAGGWTSFFMVFGIDIYPYFHMTVPLYPIIMTYAIVNYHLMDIEVVIKKTLVFAGLSSFVFACFFIPLFLLPRFFVESITKELQLWLLVIAGIVVASVVGPLNRFLIDITDKYLFQKKINYRLLLREASEYLAHVDSLKQQARNIVAFLLKKARIANASVYAFAAPDRSALVLKSSRPLITDENLKRISLSHPIFEYFSRHQGPVEINALRKAEENNAKSQGLDEILALMKSLQAEAAIPCFGGEAASRFDKKSSRLKGVLFLGHQKSDEPYSEEDMDVFFTLGQESSIAFENARLYDEAINRAAELAKANEELSETNKKLKETHAALLEEKKRAVLAGLGKSVAHEIRSPISPINTHLHFSRKRLEEMKGLYEMSLSKPSETNHQKYLKNFQSVMDLLSEIEKCKDRIQGVVNTLYNLVAERTGNKVEVKLDMVVQSAIEEVKYQTYWETLSQPAIENAVPRQLPFAYGIPQDLQGVFVNLVVNSLFALQKTANKKITIEGMVDPADPDMVKIEFSDNGCGMTEEELKKCFDHGYTTRGAKGTGLGLFYCKHIIEEVHQGTIRVKSQLGVGTCFTVLLPRYKKQVSNV